LHFCISGPLAFRERVRVRAAEMSPRPSGTDRRLVADTTKWSGSEAWSSRLPRCSFLRDASPVTIHSPVKHLSSLNAASACHPERSEGSRLGPRAHWRCMRNGKAGGEMVFQ
jgi:hypothetical protein